MYDASDSNVTIQATQTAAAVTDIDGMSTPLPVTRSGLETLPIPPISNVLYNSDSEMESNATYDQAVFVNEV